ncbi:hypothetical protein [Sinomicrobium sp. M5D2P9]
MKTDFYKIKSLKTTLRVVCLLFLFTAGFSGFAQVIVPFEPRISDKAPAPYTNVTNYNLQGDFTMIGNTNMTLVNYSDFTNNSNTDMRYVDIDGDQNTLNSSSATLILEGEEECSEIIYAGLYWSGRAHNGSSSNTFTVGGKQLDKRKVKLKKAGGTYQEVTAGQNDIYYPTTSHDYMYSAYADVTDYVRENGAGEYFVADMALREGNGGGTGYYGGWGLVVVYKNPAMKWRDITVFDGHGYVAGGTGNHELPVSGFKAAQNGDVAVTIGMMAGEGDVGIPGDYFQIRNAANSNWIYLSHGGNTTNNFFNSSIYTGGNSRNPDLLNNTGIDISMFDLNNNSNQIIANSQSSTRFRYGTTQDTYIIYNIVFAVDAYVPEVDGVNTPTDTGIIHDGVVDPGQEIEFDLSIYNRGTEAINNARVEIPLPPNVHFVEASAETLGGTITWEHSYSNDPNETPGGKIIWDIGTIPLGSTPDELLGKLRYKIRITDNCTLLTTSAGGCGLTIPINGQITGAGATSGTPLNTEFIREYASGDCYGPVYGDFVSTINIAGVTCPDVTEEGFKRFTSFCKGGSVPGITVTDVYPSGTIFYDGIPGETGSQEVTGDFPANNDGTTVTRFYAVIPGMEPGCYLQLETILKKCMVITNPMLPSKAKQ